MHTFVFACMHGLMQRAAGAAGSLISVTGLQYDVGVDLQGESKQRITRIGIKHCTESNNELGSFFFFF